MTEALDGFNGGIAIGGRMLSRDDIIVLASTVEELQELVTRLEQAR